MPIQTRVTELLGIQHPVIMGGMTGVGTPELAAAVSNAGGLGIIAIHNAGSPEKGREWIRRLRTLTSKPFGVNLTILPSMGPPPPYAEYAKVIIEEGIKIVETAGSSPKQWVKLFKDAGIITIHKCVTIRHALSAERYGVDIISLDGFECAGHPGEEDIGNFVLQAKGAKVLTRPYVCSGGVGDGKQIVAALALGADGVNCGTRFCATKECNWPDSFKERMIRASESDTGLGCNRLPLQLTAIVYDCSLLYHFCNIAI
jgi:nitronate monooxygenase